MLLKAGRISHRGEYQHFSGSLELSRPLCFWSWSFCEADKTASWNMFWSCGHIIGPNTATWLSLPLCVLREFV